MVLSDHCGRPWSTFCSTSFRRFRSFLFFGWSKKGPGGSRGRFGRVLGGLEGVRGSPGSVLGGSWAVLERSWRPSCSKTIFDRFLDNFGVVLGAQKGAKREPKRDQKWTKIEGKNDVEKRCFSRPSWSRLGAILGHFGGHLGVRKSIFVLEKPIREQNSRFS